MAKSTPYLASKVEPVDTTGAGDTFNGAFATAIVNGKSLADALHYRNAAAALHPTFPALKAVCLRRTRSLHSFGKRVSILNRKRSYPCNDTVF